MPIQLHPENALLMVVDLQERLLPAIHENEKILRRGEVLIRAARILNIPILWTEQYRKGLGPTDPLIAAALEGTARPLEKMAFGCFNDEAILRAAQATEREQLILCGIETHVCILQTALAALDDDWDVFVAEDAVSSRRPADRDAALRRMTQAGAVPATAEMLIMEALGEAGGPAFKAILPLLKDA
jgi:nicotinamidase-related amidase